jgi:hypothetical protein
VIKADSRQRWELANIGPLEILLIVVALLIIAGVIGVVLFAIWRGYSSPKARKH